MHLMTSARRSARVGGFIYVVSGDAGTNEGAGIPERSLVVQVTRCLKKYGQVADWGRLHQHFAGNNSCRLHATHISELQLLIQSRNACEGTYWASLSSNF